MTLATTVSFFIEMELYLQQQHGAECEAVMGAAMIADERGTLEPWRLCSMPGLVVFRCVVFPLPSVDPCCNHRPPAEKLLELSRGSNVLLVVSVPSW